jgi:hypothetical protein
VDSGQKIGFSRVAHLPASDCDGRGTVPSLARKSGRFLEWSGSQRKKIRRSLGVYLVSGINKRSDVLSRAGMELSGGCRIIQSERPTIPRIPLVQWVQDLREIARPGACESSRVLFCHHQPAAWFMPPTIAADQTMLSMVTVGRSGSIHVKWLRLVA